LFLGGAAAINAVVVFAALEFAEKLSFVSGYRFSDTATRLKSTAPLGAEPSQIATNEIAFPMCFRFGAGLDHGGRHRHAAAGAAAGAPDSTLEAMALCTTMSPWA
jgi:hypothetical protein